MRTEPPPPAPRARISTRTLKGVSEGSISAVSGSVAGLMSAFTVCPLDVVKTKLQVQGTFVMQGQEKLYHGVVGTMKCIVAEDGLRGLYRGLTPLLVGYLPSWTLYFYVYSGLRARLPDTTVGNVCAAVVSGASSTIVTNPIWVVKTRLMAQSQHTAWHYTGMLDAFRSILRDESPRALYSGLCSTFLGLPHVGIQFTLYEKLKRRLVRPGRSDRENTLGFLLSSIVSKVIASTATFPHEVIRARNQIQSRDEKYRGVVRTVRTLWFEEGWRSFYAGLGANICRAVPASAVTLVTYELVSQKLRRHFAGASSTDVVYIKADDGCA